MGKICKFHIIRPKDCSYCKYRKNYNLSINNFPYGIAICCNESDVLKSLKFAKDNNIDFRIRGHRHDFEGNSNIDCGLVIDLSKIDYVNIDESEETATVGGGATFGKIYESLVERGFTTPGGTCSDVGSTGLSTAAGVGYATRHLGLTLDNIIEFTLINSELEILTVNSSTNWDLFWAIKGAQPSSFGIITEIKFKIYRVSDVSYFKSTWYIKDSIELIDTFQKFSFSTDERLTMNLVFSKECDSSLSLNINGQFFGDKLTLEALISPLFEVADPKSITIETVPYNQIIEIWNEECFPPNKFKNSGSFLYEDLKKNDIERLLGFVKSAPKGFLHYIEMLSLGGKVLNYPDNSAVFPHRHAHYLLQVKCIWEACDDETLNKHWTNTFKDFLDTIGVGNYRGFTDFNISNWQFQYFGYNYEILRGVKSKYDPTNLFKFYQSVQPLKYDFSSLTGNVITPENPNYNNAKTLYNLYFDYFPIVIVYAFNFDDVKNAINWAKKNYINVRIRGGGHNYEGFSSANYSMLLDISNLKSFKLNSYSNTITIGSGFNLGELYEKVSKLGYQFTGGTCPGVGVTGLVSGGGVGLSARIYGLACDNLTSIKLINDNGDLVMATNNYNSDLFFAIRGGGGENFGVIVELTFKVRPVKNITYINIKWPSSMNFDVIKTYDHFMFNADSRVTIELSVSKNGSSMEGFSYARLEDTKKIIAPLLNIPNKTYECIKYIPFLEATQNVGQNQLPNNYFKNSSSYTHKYLSDEAINTILINLNNTPTSGFAHSILIIPFGGAVKENSILNTSYAHRCALYLIQYVSRWNNGDDGESNIQWIENFRNSMLPYSNFAYVNFPDINLLDYTKEYYSSQNNALTLIDIKNQYIKNRWIFNFPQSLR